MEVLNSAQLYDWYQERQRVNQMRTRLSNDAFPLESEVDLPTHKDWRVNPNSPQVVFRGDGRFFTVDHVGIENGAARWSQPMIRERDAKPWSVEGGKVVPVTGLIACVRTNVDNAMAHLIHAKNEPGAPQQDHLLLTHAVQASFSNALTNPNGVPLWKELAIPLGEKFKQDESLEAFAVPQDGGRFYGKHNLFVRRELTQEQAEALNLPASHVWTTREAIRDMQRKALVSDFMLQGFGL